MLSAALLAAPFLEPRLVSAGLARFCAALLDDSARGNISQGGVLRLVHGHCRASDRISLAGLYDQRFRRISLLHKRRSSFSLYAALQAIQVALFALLVRIAGWGPVCHLSANVLGGGRIFISAAFSLARGQLAGRIFRGLSRAPISSDLTARVSSSYGLTRRCYKLCCSTRQEPVGTFSCRLVVLFLRSRCRWFMDSKAESVGEEMATARQIARDGRGAGQRGYRS